MNKRILSIVLLVFVFSSLSCSLVDNLVQSESAEPEVIELPEQSAEPQTSSEQAAPTSQVQLPIISGDTGNTELVRQWAGEAVASSEYGSSDWSAMKATGVTNTYECGDMTSAWAAANSDSVEWINVYFFSPMYPVEINIVQTYNPDQVVQVDLIDMQGQYITIYTAQPQMVEAPCPYFLTIPVSQSDILVQGVHITIDQSVLGIGWNEIDAVEMVGKIGEGTPVRPEINTP